MTVPDAAAERLHALYVDELLRTLMPPVHPLVNARQRDHQHRYRDPGRLPAPL